MAGITIYSDAARDDAISGLGYVIEGEVTIEGKRFLTGHYTSMEAEYHALTEALRVASINSEDREYVEAYTDCQPLVTKMRVPDGNSEDWYDRRRGCHRLLRKFDDWSLEYTSRSANEDAHRLAREALFEGRESLK